MARHGLIVVVIVLFFAAPGAPQRQTGGDTPTIAEKTAGTQKLEGFFNLYWEEKAERMWLEIGKTGAETPALPRNILRLIPPRAGVSGGEIFPRRTSSTFDPLAAAQTAADLTVSLILNPARAARLLSNRALEGNAPTLSEVIGTLLSSTWKAGAPADPTWRRSSAWWTTPSSIT
jgi:hypothetical protein